MYEFNLKLAENLGSFLQELSCEVVKGLMAMEVLYK